MKFSKEKINGLLELNVELSKVQMTILTTLTITIDTLLKGFGLMKLWLWFVVPTIHIQPINMIESIGVVLLIGYLFGKLPTLSEFNETNEETILIKSIFGIIKSCGTLLIGWLLALVM